MSLLLPWKGSDVYFYFYLKGISQIEGEEHGKISSISRHICPNCHNGQS